MKYEEQKKLEGNFQTSGFDSNVNDKLTQRNFGGKDRKDMEILF